jgi:hypothetical protein
MEDLIAVQMYGIELIVHHIVVQLNNQLEVQQLLGQTQVQHIWLHLVEEQELRWMDRKEPGGSGGGGSRDNVAGGVATQPTANPGFSNGSITQYGNAGGPSSAGFFPGGGAGGGGGGGAGGTGTTSSGPGNGSDAGNGVQFPQFTGTLIGVPALSPLSGYFAGGGGGGNDGKDVPGGLGGGGNGGRGDSKFWT